ncbi:MAG: DUF3619 family protein [Candidatus Nitrohelix vancouverensis]|uniref:DUF3619 family protein n=1 Tax=Candidatus Nitrohelix vancouverensis TaxID=2705534 RepID=A0A7T0C1L0_9BACT|nr:MAG: DUF3619 family protein [Candidatus Nitrohelix vancouverensis]
MNDSQDSKLLKQIQNALNEGVDTMDADTRSRLSAVRRNAVKQSASPWRWLRWQPVQATGWATALALLVGVLYWQQPQTSMTGIEDLDLLASEDSLDLYEDLEFYAWVADEQVDAG